MPHGLTQRARQPRGPHCVSLQPGRTDFGGDAAEAILSAFSEELPRVIGLNATAVLFFRPCHGRRTLRRAADHPVGDDGPRGVTACAAVAAA